MQEICILILNPTTLPNSLMSPSVFLVASLGCSVYSITSPSNSNNFTTSFPIYISFTSFSSLIAVARTSKTMLNRSGDNGHFCLVSNLRSNEFSFSPLRMMLAMCLSYMAFIMASIPTF